MTLSIGVDVGGTNLRIGVVEGMRVISLQSLHTDFSRLCRESTEDTAWVAIVNAIASPLQQMLASYPQVTSIGVGFPGFIDPINRIVLQSPNLPGLHGVDLASELSARLGKPLIVENDAAAAAYGEYRLSADEGSLIYIGLGTGVGGGLVLNGQLYTGQHGAAMEVGHIIIDVSPSARPCGCGNRGCLEQYASASGVIRSYAQATGSEIDAIRIAELARAGNVNARAAFGIAGTCLAQAIAHLAKVLDVRQVVIGGGLRNAWDMMEAAFHERLQTDLIPALRGNLAVRISASGDQAGIIGAALLSSFIELRP